MFSIISGKKSFDDRWIGSPYLNRHGLHRWRMKAAQSCVGIRRSLARRYGKLMDDAVQQLHAEGYAVVGNFLALDEFEALAGEVGAAFRAAESKQPVHENRIQGFGRKLRFPGGFDRYDGGTLNRFLEINPEKHPAAARFARDARLDPLTSAICGKPHNPRKTHLYLTVHGSEQSNPDLQKVMHRDTWFSSMKFWFFIRPVTPDDGPFVYVPGSHLLTAERLEWEQQIANQAATGQASADNQGGSFRISDGELSRLGLPEPVTITSAANTLVIANTLGFHRRGCARPDTRRLAVYGWHRPYPFGMVGI